LAVPVECTVAMGPHSMFLDPRGVASLQAPPGVARHSHSGHADHDQGNAVADRTMRAQHSVPHQSTMVTPSGQPPFRVATSSDDATPGAALPRPAGFAGDAIVSITIPGTEHAPALVGSLVRAPVEERTLPKALLLGPEPPPPRS
jgi:hypothetical protein